MKEKRKNRLKFFSEHAKTGVLCLGLQLAPCTKRKKRKKRKSSTPRCEVSFLCLFSTDFHSD